LKLKTNEDEKNTMRLIPVFKEIDWPIPIITASG